METTLANARYERKYTLAGISTEQVINLVRLHPALFYEPYPERTVNNIYLDTPDLRHYLEHSNGASRRTKVRVRWYGRFGGPIARPVLEFKSRDGVVGGKESYPFPAFVLNGSFPRSALVEAQRHRGIPEAARWQLAGLRPSLGNRYRRRYFCTADRSVRLTVDWALEFIEVAGAHQHLRQLPPEHRLVVVELKYPPEVSERAVEIARQFPFQLTRCSKYVMGVDLLPVPIH